ncbi:oxidoreductase [Amycolatopsis sp. MtRt-6]|uniref:oxidoreductase n=1 Tax=Amycolatopsis sp. MtRt-6 TaxID=2792782 RepID=UPI0027DEAA9A|nr:oxidoreductase [Amycolatopsis sp. MtRt-6]
MSHETNAAAAGRLRLADGVSVNRVGYGAMQLPGQMVWGPPEDHDAAIAVLRRAVELGVDHIDTSDAYGPHVANELIREALAPYREDIVIATKVGVERDEWKSFNAAASPESLRDQVEENLARLGKGVLDLVYLRVGGDGLMFPDESTSFADSFQTLVKLRERGLIKNLGLSGVTVEQIEEARKQAPVVSVQNRFHLLDRAAEVLTHCEQNGIAFVPYFPLAAGMLKPGLDKSRLPPGMGPTDEQEKTLDGVAERTNASRTQVALAWLLARSPSILLIPGTKNAAHLEENIAAAGLKLSDEDIAELGKLAG